MPTQKRLADNQGIASFEHSRSRRAGLPAARPPKSLVAQQEDMAIGCIKSHPVKSREALLQWAERHDYCQVCWIDDRAARWARRTGLQTHHIIKAGRSDEPCNLLRVCEQCHRSIEGEHVPDGKRGYYPQLTLAHVLHCKREHDPHEYNPDRLTMLWRNRRRLDGYDPLPVPEPLPEAFLAERRRRRRLHGCFSCNEISQDRAPPP